MGPGLELRARLAAGARRGGKGRHGLFPRGRQLGLPGRTDRQDDDVEAVGFAVVVMMGVAVLPVVVIMIMIVIVAVVIIVPDHQFVGAGGKPVGASPLEGIFGLEEFGVELGGAVEVEAADVQDPAEIDRAIPGPVDPGHGVDSADARLDRVELGRRRSQVGLC